MYKNAKVLKKTVVLKLNLTDGDSSVYNRKLLNMLIFENIKELQTLLDIHRTKNNTIGFVPTMGALHNGHLSLINASNENNDISVCSIFVNPTQFNNISDLDNYPRTLEADIALLEKANCDIVFIPNVETMYPKEDRKIIFNFGSFEQVMEGKDRPGHFQGVGEIVKKLFEVIMPDNSYFGKKDYQQLLIIKELVRQYNLSPNIIGCEIIREDDGLAMSSRNTRLTKEQRAQSPIIHQTLLWAKENSINYSPKELTEEVNKRINANSEMIITYFEISEASSLRSCKEWKKGVHYIGFIVVQMGSVRLIDNIDIVF